MSLRRRIRNLKLMLLDVDGVLTDGRLYYLSDGERVKVFNVHDGLGIKLLQGAGIDVGVISGRSSEPLRNRLLELGIELIFMGKLNKENVLKEVCKTKELSYRNIGFIGDDYVDIPVMKLVGFPVAVRNAHDKVKRQACYTTTACGGEGAVREVAELIISLRE